jgi:hypothetical protein
MTIREVKESDHIGVWEKYGFITIGITPDRFHNPAIGFVDTHTMYKKL